ncbi:MAG: hypothetical protein RIS25_38 [Actinomycetota bacterium]
MRKLLILVLALMMSGCASLPSYGPVKVGGPLTEPETQDFEFLPSGPVEGATQQEILEGFVAAGSAAQNGYSIARSYLTKAAASDWNPAAETIVRTSVWDMQSEGATTLSYSFGVAARVTGDGNYAVESDRSVQTLRFSFQQIDGEWRISELPDAVVLSEVTFAAAFQAYTLYFYDAGRNNLIPDVRMFARQGDPVTSVARAVIGGPSPYLSSAISAFPATTTLVTAPVSVVNGRATVDISNDILGSTTDDQRAMLTQMASSLQSISGIASVSFSINQTTLDVQPYIINTDLLEPTVDSRPLAVVDGTLGFVQSGEVEPLGNLGERIMSISPLSVSYDSAGFAAVGTASGVYFVGDSRTRISSTPSVVAPQIDDNKAVWWVNRGSNKISVTLGDVHRTFRGVWPSTASVTALEVARDNSRLAVLVDTGTSAKLYVASIVRSDSGVPISVGSFRELDIDADSATDIAWASSTQIAVLAVNGSNQFVALASVGGMTVTLGQPRQPLAIVGGNDGRAGVTVLTDEGMVWQPRGAGWQSTGVTATLIATQR